MSNSQNANAPRVRASRPRRFLLRARTNAWPSSALATTGGGAGFQVMIE